MAKAQSRQVTQQERLTGLREALAAVGALLNDLDQNGLVIGGVAASLLGKPRLTADVDVVVGVGLEQLPRVLECAKSRHLNPRYDPGHFQSCRAPTQRYVGYSGSNRQQS